MLPFFTAFEVNHEKHTLKPYMAPVNHNVIDETTWLKIVHTLMGNFCQDDDDVKGMVAMEDMGNDVESDILNGGDRYAGDEDRREQVKHTLIELFNAASL